MKSAQWSILLALAVAPRFLTAEGCGTEPSLPPEDQLACDMAWTGDVVALGTSSAEANTALLFPDIDQAYVLTVPSSGTGYGTLEIPDWHVEWMIYHAPDTALTFAGGEVVEAMAPISGCTTVDGLMGENRLFHDWGSYPFTVTAPPGSQVWFMAFDPLQLP